MLPLLGGASPIRISKEPVRGQLACVFAQP